MIQLRLGLQQRVFPAYRAAFFDALAEICGRGLSVFAGNPQAEEALGETGVLRVARYARARNIHLGRGPLLVYWQAGLLRWLEEWQPDALILEVNPRNLSNRVAMRWMHARGKPVIGWGLGPGGIRSPGSLLSRARTGYLRHFDALVAYSAQGAEQFSAAGFPPETIFVAPNAVTPRPASPAPERPAFYQNDRPSLLFVGRLQARKRVDSLLRACAGLPAEIQPALTIVGDGPERAALEELARSVYPQALFTGARTGADLDPYYVAADLFVLPGTGGLAIQQAMSRGLPVLVGEADGTQSDLVRASNGWIIPPGDERTLVECLKAALSEVQRLRQMGRESYRIVAEEVNLERMVGVFENAVRAVTARTQKG